jgi:RHS repeat-associated protein
VYRFSPVQAMIGVTDPLEQTRTFDRSSGNQIVGITGAAVCGVCGDSGSGDQSFSYDSFGNLTSETDALGNTTGLVYDPTFNKVTSIKDPLGNTTSFTYDSHGNLQTQKDANGNVTSYQYDQYGELVKVTDPTGQATSLSYDSFGNVTSIKDPLGNTTALQYDATGRLTIAQDALGRTTRIEYDQVNRIVKQTSAQNGVTSFKYDQVGNLLSVTDPRLSQTSFTYDFMNRLSTRTDPNNRKDTRTYDLNQNLVQFQDRRGQISNFTYDMANRLIGETYQDGSNVTRSYDAGRLARVNDSAGGVFQFAYDLAGRLTGSATPYGAVNYTRDKLGRASSRQVLGQTSVSYMYDMAGNLVSASAAAAGVNRTYNARNLVSTVSRMNGVASQYTYDQLGRLASLTHSGPSSVLNTQSYAYDAVGNRNGATNSFAQSLVTQPVSSALYDGDNQQVQFGSTGNTFDADGNLISSTASSASTGYTWDSRGRLTAVSAPNGQITRFAYDFAGILIHQADSGPSANVTQEFVPDDLTDVAYVNRSDGDQYSVLAGQSIDDHLAVIHGNGQIEYGLTDAVNSTVATVDQNGTAKGRFLYEPFGQTTASNSTYPFQYTGRSAVSSDLYYYRARFYNAASGRFLSEDPIGFGGGDTNLYRYVSNQPITANDPLGLVGWVKQAEEYWFERAQQFADEGNTAAAVTDFLISKSIVAAESLPTPLGIVLDVTEAITDRCLTLGRRVRDIGLAVIPEIKALRSEETLTRLYRLTGSNPAQAIHYARNLRRILDRGKTFYDLIYGGSQASQ